MSQSMAQRLQEILGADLKASTQENPQKLWHYYSETSGEHYTWAPSPGHLICFNIDQDEEGEHCFVDQWGPSMGGPPMPCFYQADALVAFVKRVGTGSP